MATVSFRKIEKAYGPVKVIHGIGFDIAGARAHGFRVARIARLPDDTLRRDLAGAATIGPALMFKALRLRPERLGFEADVTIATLTDLAALVARGEDAWGR